ncbi:alpha-L-rhamnosidase-like protein [Novosphingobium sp. PhB55]|uniref:glycosyl hydrolase n=1 Tax=Novosphingobium sp. PhB55 TaxID=2485106 RepID=UPI0010E3B2FF|nr:glycosyl hydrolase [Novosphingobium sp. PhB55]TDW68252.1 alpha-L-rhamnosidase-like protein [Novosphingobium sp. PhB55]
MDARPRVWWHWINGNITEEGLLKDLAWMKRVGIGGAQSFDVNLQSPQIVDQRLVYMTPAWQKAFKAATREADRLGLELAIASSPGWSETGGPWVSPADGMKKLVWSEVTLGGGTGGGKRVTLTLPAPPTVTGPYQSIAAASGTNSTINEKAPDVPAPFYRDVRVLAVPALASTGSALPAFADSSGKPVDAKTLTDGDFETGIDLAKAAKGPTLLAVRYPTARTIRAMTLFVPGGSGKFIGANLKASLEAEVSAGVWTTVTDVPLARVPTTLAFAPVTARNFRVSFQEVSSLPDIAPPPAGVDLSALAAGFSGGRPSTSIRITEIELSGQERVNRVEAKAGFDIVPDYYPLDAGLADSAGVPPGRILDLTDRLRPDGTLEWTPPAGRWRIIRFGYSLVGTMNHPAPFEATGLEVDKYDAEAVRRYMDHYLATYRQTVGPDLMGRRGIRAILNDSIEVGAANWTPQMIPQFKRLRGYDPVPWMPALTGTIVGSRQESERFLHDFRRTLADLLASEHYGTIAKAAHDHELIVYGEALEDHRPLLGDDMAMRRWADVPMSAMWSFQRDRGPKPSYLADMKGAASVAHVYGRKYVAAESLTSMLSPWAFAPGDLKRMIDLEFATGVNRPIIHTSVHVPVEGKKPGLRLSIFGQDFNRNEAWAELARPWMDYIARNSHLLQQGTNVADIAYFYGEEAPLTSLFGDKPVAEVPAGNAFDFVNADALLGALSNDGSDLVSTGGARYRVLYLGGSASRMSLAVLVRIAELVEAGATVIGPRPTSDPGLTADPARYQALLEKLWPGSPVTEIGRGRVIAAADLAGALSQAGIAPDFAFEGGKQGAALPFVHRRLPGGDIYFVANQKDRTETITARFRVTGKVPELWHADTGKSEPVSFTVQGGVTAIPLSLASDESVHVVFRKDTAETSRKVAPVELTKAALLAGPWSVAFEHDRGAPPETRLAELSPLNENTQASIRYFSGIATYTKEFVAPRGWKKGKPLLLDLGEAREIAEVKVNGQFAGYAWHKPYRIDIGAQMHAGKNRLSIRVANLWVNRLIGDAQPGNGEAGAKNVTWTATPTYRKDAPLRPSGLLGPVQLLLQR